MSDYDDQGGGRHKADEEAKPIKGNKKLNMPIINLNKHFAENNYAELDSLPSDKFKIESDERLGKKLKDYDELQFVSSEERRQQ